MKTRTVETVTSNEELVRLRIFDGVITPDEGAAEILSLEQGRADRAEKQLRTALQKLARIQEILLEKD